MIKLIVGFCVLILGIFIGDYLAKVTKEELKSGQKWFRVIVLVSLFMGFSGLVLGNDFVLFSGFFVAIVTSRSLGNKGKKIKMIRGKKGNK